MKFCGVRTRGTIKTQQITAAIRHRINSPCVFNSASPPRPLANDIPTARSRIVTSNVYAIGRLVIRNELRYAPQSFRSIIIVIIIQITDVKRSDRSEWEGENCKDTFYILIRNEIFYLHLDYLFNKLKLK